MGHSLLVIFLLAAAEAYFGFAIGAGCHFRHYGLARSAWLSVLDCRRMGAASPLGHRASLHRAGALIFLHDLWDCMYQF
jgi:hypothetical protein